MPQRSKKCQWHFFSAGRSGYAARGNHVVRIACGRELYEFFDNLKPGGKALAAGL